VKQARYLYRGRIWHGRLEDGELVDQSGRRLTLDEVEVWLPPVIPNKMIGVALNYADHAEELGLAMPEEPVLFIKPNSSWSVTVRRWNIPGASATCTTRPNWWPSSAVRVATSARKRPWITSWGIRSPTM